MGYKSFFNDNEEYSAADVNEAIKALVTEGIEEPFEDGYAYHVEELNGIICAISNEGIVPETVDSCKCVINNDEKMVRISPGTVFLNDGSRIVFDAEGVTLGYEENKVNYVYVLSSSSENRSYPVCSEAVPAEDSYVMLAEISENGVLTDKRKYARGKLPGYQSNAGLPMYIDDAVTLSVKPESNTSFGDATYTICLGENNNYSIVVYEGTLNGGKGINWTGYYDMQRDVYRSVYYSGNELMVNLSAIIVDGNTDYSRGYLKFVRNGTELNIEISGYCSASNRPDKIEIPIKLTLY